MMRLLVFAVLWGLTLAAAASQFGGETIREFDALIEVRQDGALEVTETIMVNAEGRQIKRGNCNHSFLFAYSSVFSLSEKKYHAQ